jgi:hypothetical protein
MNAMGDIFRESPLYLGIFWLVVFGAFTKSAQWPFQFWLPGAMAAPTPVSAYLHSATMVMAGVFLLARFTPSLGGTDVWIWTLTLVGALTMVQASIWALRQTDLKLMMAYTTVMALGALTMLIGQGTPMAITAAINGYVRWRRKFVVKGSSQQQGSRGWPDRHSECCDTVTVRDRTVIVTPRYIGHVPASRTSNHVPERPAPQRNDRA